MPTKFTLKLSYGNQMLPFFVLTIYIFRNYITPFSAFLLMVNVKDSSFLFSKVTKNVTEQNILQEIFYEK